MTNTGAKRFDPTQAEAHGYTEADWAEVADNPEWGEADFAEAQSFADACPDLDASIKRGRGRPPLEAPRQQISIRLDPDVIAKFKATGRGWQSRINAILRDAEI